MQNQTSAPANHVLNPFIEKHRKDVMGILHSFDRLRLQGSLRYLYCAKIFEEYLNQAKVLCKDFKAFATGLTNEVCQSAERLAQTLKRPFTYLSSSALSKEELARDLAQRDRIKEGLVAIFRCVEPCRTYKMRGNYQTKMLEPRLEWGKCLHLYFYVEHPRLGLLHLRLQTWFPFLIHICLNGHDWLARQMDEQGLHYRKADNRFTWIEDLSAAQTLADAQLHTDWVALCEDLRRTYHPLHQKIGQPLHGLSYYWTAPQTEFASDVLFHDQRVLDRLLPRLILHGMLNLGSEQVMRFLGKQLNGRFGGEVVSDLRRGPEGVRLKHWVNHNSIKLYNCLNVLRPETTIHEAEDLKVYRTPETRPEAPKAWYPLRRAVADLYRRAEISRAANERYLTALAAASLTTPLAEEAAEVCQPVRRDHRRYRALNPFEATDAQLLAAVNRGQWALKGFRNREIRVLIFGEAKAKKQERSQAAKVSRRLGLLHAHGLIAKVSRTYRWQVTPKGRRVLTALLAARQADTDKLISLAV
jgi:predicted transcriptional regulator